MLIAPVPALIVSDVVVIAFGIESMTTPALPERDGLVTVSPAPAPVLATIVAAVQALFEQDQPPAP